MSLEHVRQLHRPVGRDMYLEECVNQECEHQPVCPMVDTNVCEHCYETALASEYAATEDTFPVFVWPCPTIKAANR